jgi:hypothetical protein
MKSYFESKVIKGRNLGNTKANFDDLSSSLPEEYQSRVEVLDRFQKAMIKMMEESSSVEVEPIKIKDGKVDIEEGALYHVCSPEISSLEGISVGGLLCSEWFGQLESEKEARFCAFVSAKTEKFSYNSSNEFVVYFDSNNPLMQALIKNDYFEYIKRKKQIRKKLFDSLSEHEKEKFMEVAGVLYRKYWEGKLSWRGLDEREKVEKIEKIKHKFIDKYPELLPQRLKDKLRDILKEEYGYDDIILDLFDEIVEPLSPAGKDFHDKENAPYYYWRAIPGGIPSSLVNGIQINEKYKDTISSKDIERIQKMFPKAVIFDESKRVIAGPLKKGRL